MEKPLITKIISHFFSINWMDYQIVALAVRLLCIQRKKLSLMRDFLFREKQHDRCDIIRNKSTIIEILRLDKFWKEGRKKMVNEKIGECVAVFIKLRLLTEWELTIGKLGQEQYRIKINPDFK